MRANPRNAGQHPVRDIRERFASLCREHDMRARQLYRIRCENFPQACRRVRRFESHRDLLRLELYRMERAARRAEPMHVDALRAQWRRVREADQEVREVLERAST